LTFFFNTEQRNINLRMVCERISTRYLYKNL